MAPIMIIWAFLQDLKCNELPHYTQHCTEKFAKESANLPSLTSFFVRVPCSRITDLKITSSSLAADRSSRICSTVGGDGAWCAFELDILKDSRKTITEHHNSIKSTCHPSSGRHFEC